MVTSVTSGSICVLCRLPATESLDPPRQTFSRGPDPSDPSFDITVVLPDIALCTEHAIHFRDGDQLIGWCDDPLCRVYGEIGGASACGQSYKTLVTGARSRAAADRARAKKAKTAPVGASTGQQVAEGIAQQKTEL